MPYTKRYYLEITTIQPIEDSHFNKVIDKNFPKSFYKLMACNEIIYYNNSLDKSLGRIKDVKKSEQTSIL